MQPSLLRRSFVATSDIIGEGRHEHEDTSREMVSNTQCVHQQYFSDIPVLYLVPGASVCVL